MYDLICDVIVHELQYV